MDLAAGIFRLPVDTGITHARRLFGSQFVQREVFRVDLRVNRALQWLGVGTALLGGRLWGG